MTFLLKKTQKLVQKPTKLRTLRSHPFFQLYFTLSGQKKSDYALFVSIFIIFLQILFRLYLFFKLKRSIIFFLVRILMNLRKFKVIFFCQEPFIKFLALCGIHSFLLVGIWETNMYEITNRMYHKKLSRYCTLQFPKGHSVRMACYWRRFCPVIQVYF